MKTRGKLIVLEGLDGAGTTSMMTELARDAVFDRNKMFATMEPYSLALEPLLRKFISGEYASPGWRVMSHLFTADRLLHCSHMDGYLVEGTHVICDRYHGSTVAYQSAMAPEEERAEALRTITQDFSAGTLIPDLTIFLRADLNVCAERRKKRRDLEDAFEKMEFQKTVSEAYEDWLRLVMPSGLGLYVVVDANRSYEEVLQDCLKATSLVMEN